MDRPPGQRRETPVVPLHAHRHTPVLRTSGGLALAEPATAPAIPFPAAPAPTPASVGGARARRATKQRQAHDGWTFVVVPPGVDARPRTLHVSVRRFRVAAAALATITGTAVVCGALLALVLSVAPTVQDESAGVALGLFADERLLAPRTPIPQPDLLSLLAIGPAAATVATPTETPATTVLERPLGPRTEVAERTAAAERRRVIAAPTVSGRREVARGSSAPAIAEGLPVIGRITSHFSNARRHPVLGVVRPHNGLDIAAASGTPITAPAAGRVLFAGRKFGFGNVVEIDHGHGIVTRYAHCRSLNVRTGSRVEGGATIATVGRTGLASGPHLHFEVLVDGRSVDPLRQKVESLVATRAGLSRPPAAAPAAPSVFLPGLPPTALPPQRGTGADAGAARSAGEAASDAAPGDVDDSDDR